MFHHIWDVIRPIDELHHFSEGRYTTNQNTTLIYEALFLVGEIPIVDGLVLENADTGAREERGRRTVTFLDRFGRSWHEEMSEQR